MSGMSRRRVAVQQLASRYSEYPYVFRSVSGMKFWYIFQNGSGMVPESNFGGFSEVVREWFRKRSMYRLRIYLTRIRFPVL